MWIFTDTDLEDIGDVLSRLYSVLSSPDHIDRLSKLGPEMGSKLLGELALGAGAHLGMGNLK